MVTRGGRRGRQQRGAGLAGAVHGNPWARVIKVSDFTDNGVGVIHTTGPKTVKLARKYAPLVPVLADLIARLDTPLSHPVKARILGQLRTAQERFAVIASTCRSADGSLSSRAVGQRNAGDDTRRRIPGHQAKPLVRRPSRRAAPHCRWPAGDACCPTPGV